MMPQAGPPDTSAFYHIAYTWVAVLLVGYVAILWVRGRRIRASLRAAREREPRATRGT
ncbi:MAG TPA: hypothetical protein VJO33_18755 [Gemmatimonadaceae bacterium]|nr:hypothetical protein [Gemmatimonadaceae bacterium]